MKEEALLIASRLDTVRVLNNSKAQESVLNQAQTMIRRLVEELDKKQQGLIEASGMLFNYKYELDLERAMSAQLKEELDKHK